MHVAIVQELGGSEWSLPARIGHPGRIATFATRLVAERLHLRVIRIDDPDEVLDPQLVCQAKAGWYYLQVVKDSHTDWYYLDSHGRLQLWSHQTAWTHTLYLPNWKARWIANHHWKRWRDQQKMGIPVITETSSGNLRQTEADVIASLGQA